MERSFITSWSNLSARFMQSMKNLTCSLVELNFLGIYNFVSLVVPLLNLFMT